MSTLSDGFKSQTSQTATIGLLLLGGALAALWVGINLIFPGLAPTGIPSAVTRLAIHCAILTGLWLGLSRTGFPPGRRIIIWLSVAVPFTLWLAGVWSLAVNGVFQPIPGVTRLPRLPIAIQVYRIFGGIFLVNWANGTAPGVFAWPAGIGDMLTGIMALPVALLLASGDPRGRSAAMAWNVFGLLDFAIAITMGTLSTPGPFQIFGLDIPAALAGTYPIVLIPAFAVPSSILLHA